MSLHHALTLLALAALASGCASRAPVLTFDVSGAPVPASVELRDTPFIAQQRYQCGPAALAMLLQHSGVSVTETELVPQVYLPQRKGSLQIEMIAASRRYNRIPYPIDPTLTALTTALRSGYPVLVLQNLGFKVRPVWHYAVVIGYAQEDDTIILRSGTDARQRVPAWLFLRSWRSSGNWGVLALVPDSLPDFVERRRYVAAVAAMEGIAEPEALLDAYQSALRRWPEDVITLFGLANTLHQQQRLEDAVRIYKRILVNQPGHVAALNNLAQVYFDMACFDKADQTIRSALSLSGDGHPLNAVLRETEARIRQGRDPAVDDCRAGY